MRSYIHLQPHSEIKRLHRQSNDAFPVSSAVRKEWMPAFEMQSTQDAMIVRLEVPGVEAKDLDVQVTQDVVAIAGSRQTGSQSAYSEFRYGKFRRVISLPVPVENNQVKASLDNGILTLTLPKLEPLRPKVVKVSLSNTSIPQASDRKPEVPTVEQSAPDRALEDVTAAPVNELEQDVWATV